MNLLEHAAKTHVLAPAGIKVPQSVLCGSPAEAEAAFARIGPCVVKAQVPVGGRGKAGGARMAGSANAAREAALAMLGTVMGGHRVESVLVEQRVALA